MADHDHADGPRGEEEAPRGPDPESAPPPASAPLPPRPAPPAHSDGFAAFVRQKYTQIIGAGLIGLLIGAILGGGAVAVLHRIADRHPAQWQSPMRYGWQQPGECWYTPGGRTCAYPYPYPVYPAHPPTVPLPGPSKTRVPTPVPTPTG
ncbi:hypothetical protein [Nonomuraea dietziae]|uniref:hypothetical protein n=1 Tax=Nonomuraea dietziae TaxID=65515 RepID=UPI003439DB99